MCFVQGKMNILAIMIIFSTHIDRSMNNLVATYFLLPWWFLEILEYLSDARTPTGPSTWLVLLDEPSLIIMVTGIYQSIKSQNYNWEECPVRNHTIAYTTCRWISRCQRCIWSTLICFSSKVVILEASMESHNRIEPENPRDNACSVLLCCVPSIDFPPTKHPVTVTSSLCPIDFSYLSNVCVSERGAVARHTERKRHVQSLFPLSVVCFVCVYINVTGSTFFASIETLLLWLCCVFLCGFVTRQHWTDSLSESCLPSMRCDYEGNLGDAKTPAAPGPLRNPRRKHVRHHNVWKCKRYYRDGMGISTGGACHTCLLETIPFSKEFNIKK